MKRVGVVSNPRSGTSLMVRLLVTCFDLSYTRPLFPQLDTSDIYEYRAEPGDLVAWGNKNYKTVFVLRDPRSVVVSRHPSTGDYLVDFGVWLDNYYASIDASKVVDMYTVSFEELLLNPDRVQSELSLFFSLPINRLFSEFHNYAPVFNLSRRQELEKEMGGVRKIVPTSTPPWEKAEHRERIKKQLLLYPSFTGFLVKFGFEKDDSWLGRI